MVHPTQRGIPLPLSSNCYNSHKGIHSTGYTAHHRIEDGQFSPFPTEFANINVGKEGKSENTYHHKEPKFRCGKPQRTTDDSLPQTENLGDMIAYLDLFSWLQVYPESNSLNCFKFDGLIKPVFWE